MDLKEQRELTRAIRKELSEIDLLKEKMEHPDYKGAGELSRIDEARKRVAKLKRELILCGGEYKPTAAERRSEKFDKNIPYISSLELCISGVFWGSEKKRLVVNEDEAFIEKELFLVYQPKEEYPKERVDKTAFFDGIAALHIGEWRRKYDISRFGFLMLDGVQWSLNISYSNGTPTRKIHGDNSFPYNFERLLKLFGMENAFRY